MPPTCSRVLTFAPPIGNVLSANTFTIEGEHKMVGGRRIEHALTIRVIIFNGGRRMHGRCRNKKNTRVVWVFRRILALTVAATALLTVPASAQAVFSISSVSSASSTRQAAGHPTMSTRFYRNGTAAEDLRDVAFEAPPGLLLNLDAVVAKCVEGSFVVDACPATSAVGSVSGQISIDSAFGWRKSYTGSVYVLESVAGQAATLGIVMRTPGYAKAFIRSQVHLRPGDGVQVAKFSNFPTSLGSTQITLVNMTTFFNARTGLAKNGDYFVLNPSSCATATGRIVATSNQGVTRTGSFAYTPVNCSIVTLPSAMSVAFQPSQALAPARPEFEIQVPTGDATVQSSTVRSASFTLQAGADLDPSSLSGVTRCASVDLASNSCPASARIGSVSTGGPFYPPVPGGVVYLIEGVGYPIAAVMPVSSEVMQIIRGAIDTVGSGYSASMRLTLGPLPQIPFSRLKISFDVLNVGLPNDCAPRTADASVSGHSGAISSAAVPTQVENCIHAPNTTITSAPVSPSNDNTPHFSFIGEYPIDTYECSLDGGPWLACSPPFAPPPLTDGSHELSVRAVNAAGADPTPATYAWDVDTASPDFDFHVIPSGGDIVGAINFTTDEVGGIFACRIDGDPWFACASPEWLPFLPEGSHTICVRLTDAAGNVTEKCQTTIVLPPPPPMEPQITYGPRAGLAITDRTPTFGFTNLGGASVDFECRLDSISWVSCASTYTTPQLANGPHTFEVRAVDPSNPSNVSLSEPASFAVADFLPTASLAPSTMQAAAHADLSLQLTNSAGDLATARFTLPDGMWLAAAASQCPVADALAHACDSSTRVGSVTISAVSDANAPMVLNGDVFATTAPGGSGRMGGLVIDAGPVSVGGKDYGRFISTASVSARNDVGQGPPDLVNPQSSVVDFGDLASSTIANPGADGATNLHLRDLAVSLTGNDVAYARPLETNPSSCDPLVQYMALNDSEGNAMDLQSGAQFINCAAVPFDPSVSFASSAIAPAAFTTLAFGASFPPDNGSLKFATFTMPLGIQVGFYGISSGCSMADAAQSPPACDPSTTRVGTITIKTPLLPAPLTGSVYLEDLGGVLPALYGYIADSSLGIEWRVRTGHFTTSGSPSRVYFSLAVSNSNSDSTFSDIPISGVDYSLNGSPVNGPMFRLSSACRKTGSMDASLDSWSGASVTRSAAVAFPASCPN